MTKKSKKTIERTFKERRGDIAKRMHIAKMGDGFHIIEIPGGDGEPYVNWSCWFASKRAAELFLDDLLDSYANGDMQLCGALCSLYKYEQQARVLEFLEKLENIADLNQLARDLVDFRPWLNRPPGSSGDIDSDLPLLISARNASTAEK